MMTKIFLLSDCTIRTELDMIPDDAIIIKIEPEDSSYDYYDNSNNISWLHYEVGSKNSVSKSLESSNNLNIQSPPSAVQLGVIKAEPEVPDIVPDENAIVIKSECDDLDFLFQEIDFSEDIIPYLLPVESNVETDNENFKECGLSLDPRRDHAYAKQPEHVDKSANSSSSSSRDEVDVTSVDNDFSILFREECKTKVKRRKRRKRTELSHRKRHLPQKAGENRRPAKSEGKDAQQKWDKKEATSSKSISAAATSGALYAIPRTSTETFTRRIRKLVQQYIPPTPSSSIISRSSSSRTSIPDIEELEDERARERNRIAEKKRRSRNTCLMNKLRLLVPVVSCDPKAAQIKILTYSMKYMDNLAQNLKTNRKMIKVLRNKNRTLVEQFKKEFKNLSLNSRGIIRELEL